MFVINIVDGTGYSYFIGNGGTYQFQGEKYAVVVEREYEAKKYKSFNIAYNAYKKLNKSCCNINGRVNIYAVEEMASNEK